MTDAPNEKRKRKTDCLGLAGRERRIVWLLAHRPLWRFSWRHLGTHDWPYNEAVAVVDAMRDEGLYSRTTGTLDAFGSLRRLIEEIHEREAEVQP